MVGDFAWWSIVFTQDEIDLIQSSFAPTKPVGAKAATMMFANLFEANGEFEILFSEISGPPKTMLWATLGLIVDNLEDIKSLDVPLSQLGARHQSFGATPKRYGEFADIIIGTIASINGEGWTPAHEDAWEKVLGHVVDTMVAGAAAEQSTAA